MSNTEAQQAIDHLVKHPPRTFTQPPPTPPTINRLVHFVLADGQHRAALVVNVADAPDEFSATLNVELDAFTDIEVEFRGVVHALKPHVRGDFIGGLYFGDGTLRLKNIPYDPDGKAPGTWHYAEPALTAPLPSRSTP